MVMRNCWAPPVAALGLVGILWPAPSIGQDDGADYLIKLRIVTYYPLGLDDPHARPSFIEKEWYPDVRGPSGYQRLAPIEYLDGAAPDVQVERQLAAQDPNFTFKVVASAGARTRAGSRLRLDAQSGTLLDMVGAPMWFKAYFVFTPRRMVGIEDWMIAEWQEDGSSTNLVQSTGQSPPAELKVGGTYRFLTTPASRAAASEPDGEEPPITNSVPGHFALVSILPASAPRKRGAEQPVK